MTQAVVRTDLQVRMPDGSVVGYAEVGDPRGCPVLHLHGTPSSRLELRHREFHEAAAKVGVRLLAPDRPGVGISTFRRYSVAGYPQLLRDFADALGVERFAVTALSGGGKFACSSAWCLPDRVTRVALDSSSCSIEVPGVHEALSRTDRRVYAVGQRAPWLLRLYFMKIARDLRRRDVGEVLSGLVEIGPAERENVFGRQEVWEAVTRQVAEAFTQGAHGPAHDYVLESRPWEVALADVRVPVEIWCGEQDAVVSPEQGRILSSVLPRAVLHVVPARGHGLITTDCAEDILRSVIRD